MKPANIYSILFLMTTLLITGCSSGGSPVAPGIETSSGRQTLKNEQHLLSGLFTFICDPASDSVEIIPARDIDFHFNALKFIEPPPFVNLTLESKPSFNGNVLDVDIGITHPLAGSPEFTIFDVCGIIFTHGSITGYDKAPNLVMTGEGDTRLLNADGYTRWWNPVEFPHGNTIFCYKDGLIGTPDAEADLNCTINGYKYFADGLAKDDPLETLHYTTRGVFSSGTKNIRHYTIDLSGGGIFNYAIDACWKPPSVNPPFNIPDDFPLEANRPEAWQISVCEEQNTLWCEPGGGMGGGELMLFIDVWDHTDPDYNDGWAEALNTGMHDVALNTWWSPKDGFKRFYITLTGRYLTMSGDAELLIAVRSDKDGYGGVLPDVSVTAYYVHKFNIATYYGPCDPDVNPPTDTIIEGPGDQPVGTTEITITVEGQDDCSEPENMTYQWCKSKNGALPDAWHPAPGPQILIPGLSGGHWYIRVRAIDEAGHKQESSDYYGFDIAMPSGTFGWAKEWGGGNENVADCVVVDDMNNVYTSGCFEGYLYFATDGDPVKIYSHGEHDAFLLSYDIDKNFQWVRGWGGMADDRAYGVAVDDAGGIYVTGHFGEIVDFDPTSGVDWRISEGGVDIFLSKFDSTGEYIWTLTWGGQGNDVTRGIVLDSFGDIYITGYFSDTIDLDPGPGIDEHTSNGNHDIFISKFDTNGNFLWARSWGGIGVDMGMGIATDSYGDTYTTGFFYEKADFDPGPATDEHITGGSDDAFLSKFNSSGDLQWAKTWGAWESDAGRAVTVDHYDNVYATGYFRYTADFHPGPGQFISASIGGADVYASMFDTNGDFHGTLTWGSGANDYGFGIATDSTGAVFVTGQVGNSLDLDPGPGVDYHGYMTSSHAFVSKFNPDCEYQWGRTCGCSELFAHCWSNSVSVDAFDSCYTAGTATGEMMDDIDPGPGQYSPDLWSREAILVKYLSSGYWYPEDG